MDDNTTIDATDLIYMPLPCLEELVFGLDANTPGTDFVLSVIRWAAMLLICGIAIPDGSNMQMAVERGAKMLAILGAFDERQR